jgi:hypothetical protein
VLYIAASVTLLFAIWQSMAFSKFLTIVALLLAMTGAASAEPKRILLLHSFGRDFSPWAEVARSFLCVPKTLSELMT